jgi:heme exporter protein A
MLTVQGLSFGFRGRRLFSGVDLTVRAGELVKLAGPNGAGKSTLLLILAGLLAAERGDVRYETASGASDDRRLYLEFLPAEANGIYLKMNALANLDFWSRLRGVGADLATVRRALARFGLDHPLLLGDFPVEKFSTGMKRRLALARLALSPAPCWLLDEPIYGLDTAGIASFRELLAEHLARGGLAVAVSHETEALKDLITQTYTIERSAA